MRIFFWLNFLALFILFILSFLFREGMFIDGIQYAVISRNMAEGAGNFWQPHFSPIMDPVFYSHPPLNFWLESLFFRLFGDQFWVERLYSLILFGLSAVFVVLIWKQVPENEGRSRDAWLPLTLWIIIPLVFWSFQHNMLENALNFFCLTSVYCQIRFLLSKSKAWLLGALAGLILAVLSKGLVGLFPLVLMPLFYLFCPNELSGKQVLGYTLLLFTGFCLFAWMLWLYSPSQIYIEHYFGKQLVRSFNGALPRDDSRLAILWRLLGELILPLIAAVLLFLFGKRSKPSQSLYRWAAFFLAIGLSASIPLLISPKLRAYYLVPSFAYLALAISVLIYPATQQLNEALKPFQKPIAGLGVLILISSLIWAGMHSREPSRDQDLIEYVKQITHEVGPNSIIHTCETLSEDFRLRWYLHRYGSISMDFRCRAEHRYFLVEDPCIDFVPALFEELDIELGSLTLYRRIE